MVKFRKTREGRWAVFGPSSHVKEGRVQVTRKDGTTTTVVVEAVSREFEVDGVMHRYGYLAEKKRGDKRDDRGRQRRDSYRGGSDDFDW